MPAATRPERARNWRADNGFRAGPGAAARPLPSDSGNAVSAGGRPRDGPLDAGCARAQSEVEVPMSTTRAALARGTRRLALLALAPLLASASGARAHGLQPPRGGRGFGFMPQQDPAVQNVPYDGRFTFARLKYTTGPGGYYYMGLPAWAHGYPRAEDNLTRIIQEISVLRPYVDGSGVRTNVLAADDPELCKYPVAYMTEAGYWTMTDKEATALRAYLLKGGFLIFDDFRPPPRGGGGWETFEANMARVLPDARVVDLDPSLPIFHSFF